MTKLCYPYRGILGFCSQHKTVCCMNAIGLKLSMCKSVELHCKLRMDTLYINIKISAWSIKLSRHTNHTFQQRVINNIYWCVECELFPFDYIYKWTMHEKKHWYLWKWHFIAIVIEQFKKHKMSMILHIFTNSQVYLKAEKSSIRIENTNLLICGVWFLPSKALASGVNFKWYD